MAQQKYVIPRFHNLALVVLSYGIVEITARQLILLMLCGLAALNLWPHLEALALFARALVAGLPSLLILPFAWVSVAGRPLESWLLVFVRYWLEPRLYTWPQPQQQPPRSSMPATKRKT